MARSNGSLLLFFLCLGYFAFSADFIVYFTNKAFSPYSIAAPAEYLSDKALERREKQKIDIDSSDIPVSELYIDSLVALGLEVRGVSKWINAAHVKGDSATVMDILAPLSFVQKSEKMSRRSGKIESVVFCEDDIVGDTVIYGQNKNQVYQLNGQYLHNRSYRGQGMQIAILDGGFNGVATNPAFEKIRNEGRLLGKYDFISNDTMVYEESSHGSNVFSIIGAEMDTQYFGTAPAAGFYLLKSEYVLSETLNEEFYLARALEYADSAGVDVVNISLGYYTFDNGIGDHTWEHLDGNTALGTIAADKAASKGMIVVNSAGNEGNDTWKYISIPSDGDSVFTIASVDNSGKISSFSSYGREDDPRVKPNIAAMGSQTVYVNSSGNIVKGNGTSYSAPLITGLVACLWQAFPYKTNMQILDAVERSSSQYFMPDNRKGYGIPDFGHAYKLLENTPPLDENTALLNVFPNPCRDRLTIQFPDVMIQSAELSIYSMIGAVLYSEKIEVGGRILYNFNWPQDVAGERGIYILRVKTNKQQYTSKVIKW